MIKKQSFIVLLPLLVMSLSGCSNVTNEGSLTITDCLNREVKVEPSKIKKVVCIGAGALRLYSYVGDIDKLCGVEDVEKGYLISIRPYYDVNKDKWANLPSCGYGGPKNQVAEPEKILACDPDVIFSLYTQSASAMDTLSTQTGKPVITLSYGNTEAFDDNITKSLNILGKVLGKESRANELVTYIDGIKSELDTKTKDIRKEDKPTIYLACQSNYGANGFQSSTSNYSIFDVSHIRNVLDENADYASKGYNKTVDLEKLVVMNPDKIIMDAGGLSKLKNEDFANEQKKTAILSLNAIKNGEVYLQMPYNAYYTNLETAYCDAYYDAKVAYPTVFSSLDIEAKANEITKKFLGVNFYSNSDLSETLSSAMYGGYQQISNLESFVETNVK
jgi:iron complex transport system substrate-binding protein